MNQQELARLCGEAYIKHEIAREYAIMHAYARDKAVLKEGRRLWKERNQAIREYQKALKEKVEA